jgi:hypothetical protein
LYFFHHHEFPSLAHPAPYRPFFELKQETLEVFVEGLELVDMAAGPDSTFVYFRELLNYLISYKCLCLKNLVRRVFAPNSLKLLVFGGHFLQLAFEIVDVRNPKQHMQSLLVVRSHLFERIPQ